MSTFRRFLLSFAILAIATVASSAQFVQGQKVSDRDVVPVGYPGNFVAVDDDQICYDLAVLGGWDTNSQELRGFKQDPPIGNTFFFNGGNSSVTTTISTDGRFLSWNTEGTNAIVLGFIIKGGPNYNFYNYGPSNPWDTDGNLSSPGNVNKKGQLVFPQISHYNLCAMPEDDDDGDDSGCTPGYWRNHTDRWAGVAVGDSFDDVFGVTSGKGADYTLLQGVNQGGGGVDALIRHAVAALLNAHGGVPNGDGTSVDYPMTPGEVIAAVQTAFGENGDIEGTKNLFEEYNQLGCPLSGTPAN